MWTVFPFVGALGLAMVITFQCGDDRMKRTAILLFGNWMACIAALWVLGSATPWAAWLVIDATTLLLVVKPPAGKVQAIIGGLLLGQVMWHGAFGYVDNAGAARVYITALNAGGWVQVGTLFIGAGFDQGRRLVAAWGSGLFRRSRAADDMARMDGKS